MLPGPGTAGVGGAAPQVDDKIPVDPHRDGRADLVAQHKVALERVAYLGELRRARALDVRLIHGSRMAPFCRTNAWPERATGIEPASLVWKTRALPLSYARMYLVERDCTW